MERHDIEARQMNKRIRRSKISVSVSSGIKTAIIKCLLNNSGCLNRTFESITMKTILSTVLAL